MRVFEHGYYTTDDLLEFGFKKVGKNVEIAKNCIIVGLENITIGDNVQIDGGTYLIAKRGFLNIGNYVHLSAGCYLSCAGGITIRDYCGLAAKVTIYSSSDDYTGEYLTNPLVPQQFRDDSPEPVILEEHCIIGTGTSILPGSTIGQGSSVGAMSLVTRKLDEWGVYFGSPAKRIKNRKKTILDYPINGKKST